MTLRYAVAKAATGGGNKTINEASRVRSLSDALGAPEP